MNEKNSKNLKINGIKYLIQGGALAVLIMVLYGVYLLMTNEFTHIGNYIQENTKVMVEVKEAVRENTKVIDKLSDKL